MKPGGCIVWQVNESPAKRQKTEAFDHLDAKHLERFAQHRAGRQGMACGLGQITRFLPPPTIEGLEGRNPQVWLQHKLNNRVEPGGPEVEWPPAGIAVLGFKVKPGELDGICKRYAEKHPKLLREGMPKEYPGAKIHCQT